MREPGDASVRRTWLVYSLLRFVVFLGVAGVLVLFGLNGFPLLLAGLLISSVLSLVLLRGQREALVRAQVARREQRRTSREALRARLDDA